MAVLLAEGALGISAAQAREERFSFDLPAGPLSGSLSRFSEITGLSIGYPGALPMVTARRVSGTMSADSALRKLLDGTLLRAVRAGPRLYRLEVEENRRSAGMAPSAGLPPVGPGADIVVTALKRPQSIDDVALSVSVLDPDRLRSASRSLASRDMSLEMEGLSMTNLGPGRNRQFIRGVADSPFLGQSQSTVAVQVDEARVTFNAPDPDLRLIDVDRVEILKGPQGPLYGSGALGGIYHIVTRQPDLEDVSGWIRLSGSVVDHGGTGSGGEGMVNLPLVDGRLALRAVGYRFLDGGWIDNQGVAKDTNSTLTSGLRLGVKWVPATDWVVDAGFAVQNIASRDSQYLLAAGRGLERPGHVAEPTDNDFTLFHGTIAGHVGGVELLSATSYVENAFSYGLDASDAAADFGLTAPAYFNDDRHYSLFNQEVRLSSGKGSRWVAGASYLRAVASGLATMTGSSGVARKVEKTHRIVTEYALFGEVSLPLLPRLDATLGARLFHSLAEDQTREAGKKRVTEATSKTSLSPSAALSYRLAGGGLVYLRYARAMRPGGLAPSGTTASGHFEADELGTFELGTRRGFWGDRLLLSGSAYYTDWHDIQSDYLLPNGLLTTRNAGRGRIVGVEAAADWLIGAGFALTLGGTAQDARLTHTADGTKLKDRRLPITPSLSGRAALSHSYRLGGWNGQAAVQANYTGKARLSFDDGLDRSMQPYTSVAINSTLERGAWTAGLRIDNLFDVRGDSFAFGNPFSIRLAPQYTPLRPRAFTLSLARRW